MGSSGIGSQDSGTEISIVDRSSLNPDSCILTPPAMHIIRQLEGLPRRGPWRRRGDRQFRRRASRARRDRAAAARAGEGGARAGDRVHVRSAPGAAACGPSNARRRSRGPNARPSCWPPHGVDWIVAYPTDEALLQLSAARFFRADRSRHARVEGAGRRAEFLLRPQSRRHDRPAARADRGGRHLARRRAAGGNRRRDRLQLARPAADCGRRRRRQRTGSLSQPYRIRGMVTHGAGRGAKIGFPTANLAGIDTLLPAPGVYAGRAWVSGERWPAAINLGPSPTFGDAIGPRRSPSHRPAGIALRPAAGG